jgi:hypothetical protein
MAVSHFDKHSLHWLQGIDKEYKAINNAHYRLGLDVL